MKFCHHSHTSWDENRRFRRAASTFRGFPSKRIRYRKVNAGYSVARPTTRSLSQRIGQGLVWVCEHGDSSSRSTGHRKHRDILDGNKRVRCPSTEPREGKPTVSQRYCIVPFAARQSAPQLIDSKPCIPPLLYVRCTLTRVVDVKFKPSFPNGLCLALLKRRRVPLQSMIHRPSLSFDFSIDSRSSAVLVFRFHHE